MRLLHNVQGQLHRPVARPAEDRTVADKGTGLERRERSLAGLPFPDFDSDAKFFEPDAVWDVGAFQHQYDRFAFFQSDLSGCEVEFLCGHFDPARRGLGTTWLNQHRRSCKYYSNYDRQSDLKFQVDFLDLSVG